MQPTYHQLLLWECCKLYCTIYIRIRYTKALEALSKTKKEISSRAKDLKGELMELGAHLHSANESKRDLSACEESEEGCLAQLDEVTERLQLADQKVRDTAVCCMAVCL